MPAGRIPRTGQIVTTHGPFDDAPAIKTLYVNKVSTDGWLQVQLDGGPRIPLAKYTKVKLTHSKNGRAYFKILDGHYRGHNASLTDHNATEYLGNIPPKQSLATITVTYGKFVPEWISVARRGQKLDQQFATAEISGINVQVTMNTVWDKNFFCLPPGKYTVLIPDAPHTGNYTAFYRDSEPRLKCDQVWFPIKFNDNSRFVHVGNVSEGCVTVMDLARWSDVHEALISHRGPDGMSVATLIVKGDPEKAK